MNRVKIKKERITAAKRRAIDRLRRRYGGLIPPEKLVEEAASPSHPFHGDFEWDDSEAAQSWRLHQARNILRVFLTVIGNGQEARECRMYVSLSTDRSHGGGYRTTVDVLRDDEMRETMLQDAREELATFRTKYAALKELSSVISAIDEVLEFKPKKKE